MKFQTIILQDGPSFVHTCQPCVSSRCPTALPALNVVSCSWYNFSHSGICVFISHCGFICISLRTNNIGQVFMCLLAICDTSLVSKSFAFFKIKLFVLLLLSCQNSLYILQTNPLLDMFDKYFLWFVFNIFLTVLFKEKSFSFDEIQLINFLLLQFVFFIA